MQRFKSYWILMRFHRPIGTLLLLWPTLSALWFANLGVPPIKYLIVFTLGVIVMRAAGCVVNDIADRNFDGKVARTKDRPLATKQISVKHAIYLACGLVGVAFGLVCFTNLDTVLLSIVALVLAAIYPFMKRFTHWPQMILGAAFAWAIPMAFMASQATLPLSCWLLFTATLIWAVAYDTLYAMVDREDDVKIGIKSTAVLTAPYDKILVFFCHLLVLSLYLFLGLLWHMPMIFFITLVMALALAVYQQWLIRDNSRENYFKAFLNNNTFGMLLFLGVSLSF